MQKTITEQRFYTLSRYHGTSDKTWTCGTQPWNPQSSRGSLRGTPDHPKVILHQGFEPFSFIFSGNRAVFTLFDAFFAISVGSLRCTLVHNDTHYEQPLCTSFLCTIQNSGPSLLFILSLIGAFVKFIFWKKWIFTKRGGAPAGTPHGRRPHRFLQRDHKE